MNTQPWRVCAYRGPLVFSATNSVLNLIQHLLAVIPEQPRLKTGICKRDGITAPKQIFMEEGFNMAHLPWQIEYRPLKHRRTSLTPLSLSLWGSFFLFRIVEVKEVSVSRGFSLLFEPGLLYGPNDLKFPYKMSTAQLPANWVSSLSQLSVVYVSCGERLWTLLPTPPARGHRKRWRPTSQTPKFMPHWGKRLLGEMKKKHVDSHSEFKEHGAGVWFLYW